MAGKLNKPEDLTVEGKAAAEKADQAADAIWRLLREEALSQSSGRKASKVTSKCGLTVSFLSDNNTQECPDGIRFKTILRLVYGLDVTFHRMIFAINPPAYRAFKLFESLSVDDVRALGALSSEDLSRLQQIIRSYIHASSAHQSSDPTGKSKKK